MNTWQTVYEQLQEIQEKIAMRWWDIEYCKKCMSVIEYEQESPNYYREYCNTCKKDSYINGTIKKAYYHPISLAWVLSALGHWYWYDFSNKMIMFMKDSFIDGIYWYLLKEDKSDAYLDEQSDETIEALHKLLVRK